MIANNQDLALTEATRMAFGFIRDSMQSVKTGVGPEVKARLAEQKKLEKKAEKEERVKAHNKRQEDEHKAAIQNKKKKKLVVFVFAFYS